MGSDSTQSGSGAGFGIAILGALIAGLAFFHDWDARKESNEWREADSKSAKEAEEKEVVRFADLSGKVKSIQDNVAQARPRRLPQPLVLANDIFERRFDFAATEINTSATKECQLPVLRLTNLGDYAALDVSVVWLIEGHPITVAVAHTALRVNEEVTSAVVPNLKSNTKVDGYLRIEFGDSSGFRGVVKHPVSLRFCPGHVHVAIEPHSSQTWQQSAGSIHTN